MQEHGTGLYLNTRTIFENSNSITSRFQRTGGLQNLLIHKRARKEMFYFSNGITGINLVFKKRIAQTLRIYRIKHVNACFLRHEPIKLSISSCELDSKDLIQWDNVHIRKIKGWELYNGPLDRGDRNGSSFISFDNILSVIYCPLLTRC